MEPVWQGSTRESPFKSLVKVPHWFPLNTHVTVTSVNPVILLRALPELSSGSKIPLTISLELRMILQNTWGKVVGNCSDKYFYIKCFPNNAFACSISWKLLGCVWLLWVLMGWLCIHGNMERDEDSTQVGLHTAPRSIARTPCLLQTLIWTPYYQNPG